MNNFENMKQVTESISAARKYVAVKEACNGRHEAFIISSVNGKDQHGVRTVFVEVTENNAVVIIEELHTLCSHQTNRFTAEKDDFYFVGNRTLQIKPKESMCGKVIIEVTAK